MFIDTITLLHKTWNVWPFLFVLFCSVETAVKYQTNRSWNKWETFTIDWAQRSAHIYLLHKTIKYYKKWPTHSAHTHTVRGGKAAENKKVNQRETLKIISFFCHVLVSGSKMLQRLPVYLECFVSLSPFDSFVYAIYVSMQWKKFVAVKLLLCIIYALRESLEHVPLKDGNRANTIKSTHDIHPNTISLFWVALETHTNSRRRRN